MRLSKEDYADDRAFENVPVPELSKTRDPKAYVRIRSLTANELDEWETSLLAKRGKDRNINRRYFRASLAALCIVDDHGKPEHTASEVESLGERSGKALSRIVNACKRLSGIGAEDEDFFSESSGETNASGSASPSR